MEYEKKRVPSYLKIGKIITYLMYLWVLFGIIVLGMRVFLLAASANPATPFVNFVYNTSASFLQPFRGIFPPRAVSETGYLDVAALFAIIVYALIGWGFSALTSYIQAKIDAYATNNAKALKAARMKQQQLVTETQLHQYEHDHERDGTPVYTPHYVSKKPVKRMV